MCCFNGLEPVLTWCLLKSSSMTAGEHHWGTYSPVLPGSFEEFKVFFLPSEHSPSFTQPNLRRMLLAHMVCLEITISYVSTTVDPAETGSARPAASQRFNE